MQKPYSHPGKHMGTFKIFFQNIRSYCFDSEVYLYSVSAIGNLHVKYVKYVNKLNTPNTLKYVNIFMALVVLQRKKKIKFGCEIFVFVVIRFVQQFQYFRCLLWSHDIFFPSGSFNWNFISMPRYQRERPVSLMLLVFL